MTGLHHLAATKMPNEESEFAHAKFTRLWMGVRQVDKV